MKLNILLVLLFVFTQNVTTAQKHTGDKFLRLEPHPADSFKFIAKFFSKENYKLMEYWEMGTSVAEIDANTFNQLKMSRQIYADGESILFYPNLRKKRVANYEKGVKTGDITGYHINGKISYKIKMNGVYPESAVFYYPDGQIRRKEVYDKSKLNVSETSFYENEQKKFVAQYLNGALNGKYQSFHPNGNVKRKSKFKDNEEVSSSCFDASGNKVECEPYYAPLNYGNDLEELRTDIEKLDFSFNKVNPDTSDFRIILEIDTIGKASMAFYYFRHADSLKTILNQWVNQLQPFSPAIVDGLPTESYLNMSFTVSGAHILWLGESNINYAITSVSGCDERRPTWFWEFPNPTNDQVFFIVDNLPKFPGGERALRAYISDHLQYPNEAKKKRIQGKVYVTFIVEKDGNVTNPKIAKSVHHLLDAEAIRVINLLPKWKPGSHRGMASRVSYTVPINFALN